MPDGQLRLDNLVVSIPDFIAQPEGRDVFEGMNSPTVRSTVAADARDEIQRGCRMAQFGVFTDKLTPFQRGSTAWLQQLNEITLDLSPHTTILDGEDWIRGGWGWVADLRKPLDEQTPPWPGVPIRTFASHLYAPGGATAPTICQEQLHHPFGVNSVLGFTSAAHVGNQPPPKPGVSVPRRQQVVFSPSSTAVLTIKDVGARTLTLKGAVEVELTNCDLSSCTANLSTFDLYTAPFSIEGTNVSLLKVSSGSSAGVLQGDTLVFPAFTGTAEAQLTNAKYDAFPIRTGVLLARWDPQANQFIMAFSISGKTSDGDEVSFDGTALGTFSNTSPDARITITSPAAVVSGDEATVECQSPAGTNIELSATTSTDLEDPALRYSWFRDGTRLGVVSNLSLGASPVGIQDLTLMAYDNRGFAGHKQMSLSVVDSLSPQLMASDVCFFPPNHRQSLIRLRYEIPVAAVDQCEGDLADNARIVGVRSSSGTGVVRWDGSSACLVLEREGNENAREYEVDVSVTDSAGNTSIDTVNVVVPHNGPVGSCLRSRASLECR